MSKMLILAQANARLFFKFLDSQGYDLWLEKVVPQSYLLRDNESLQHYSRDLDFLTNMKVFIEKFYCKEKILEENLESQQIRIVNLMKVLKPHMAEIKVEDFKEEEKKDAENLEEEKKDDEEEKDKVDEQEEEQDFATILSETGPRNVLDLELVMELKEKMKGLSELEIRYAWAILQVFNKYLENTTHEMNHQEIFEKVPESLKPMAMTSYLSQVKDLVLSSVISQVRYQLMDLTSIDSEFTAKLYFQRIQMAEAMKDDQSDGEEKEDEQDEDQGEDKIVQ